MENVEEKERITNRHIAKLLTRLSPFNFPPIALDEIKRQLWFLSEDIVNMCKKGVCDESPRKE